MLGKTIYDLFLKSAAPLEINVSDEIRREVADKLKNVPDKDTFKWVNALKVELLSRKICQIIFVLISL